MRSPGLMIASLIAATQPRLVREESTLIVTNKTSVPSDSTERLAAAEAKRQRKNARRASQRPERDMRSPALVIRGSING